jgi:hypothetical protein
MRAAISGPVNQDPLTAAGSADSGRFARLTSHGPLGRAGAPTTTSAPPLPPPRARWCDQPVLPGSVANLMNPRVRCRAMGIEAVHASKTRHPALAQASRLAGFYVRFARAVLRDEPVLLAALRCAVSSRMAVRPVGGRLREGPVQAREVGDHAVNAGDRENAEDGSGGDDQQQLAAFTLGALLRRQQGMDRGRITNRVRVMSTTSVRCPCAAACSSADRSPGALVMSISSGAVTTGTPLTTSKGNLSSCTCVTSRGRGRGRAERRVPLPSWGCWPGWVPQGALDPGPPARGSGGPRD